MAAENLIPSPLRFVPDFVRANKDGTVSLAGQFYNVLKNADPLPNLNPPIVIFRVLDKEDEALKCVEVDQVVGQKGVLIGRPNWKDFKEILGNGAADTRYTPGKISVSGYKAFFFSSILLHAAYSVSSKPVNECEMPVSYLASRFFQLDGSSETLKAYNHGISDVTTVQSDPDISLSGKGHTMAATRLLSLAYPGTAQLPASKSDFKKIAGYKKAKDGVFIEYFRDMVFPDKHIPVSIAQRLFFRCFGNDADVASSNFQIFMTGWSTLQHCEEGQALQHAFFCVSLAESAQSALIPIFMGGQYRGSVLFGDFSLIVRYKMVKREPFEDYVKYIDALDLHSKSLAEISNLFESMTTDDGSKKYHCNKEMIDTPKKFVDFFRSINMADMDTPTLNGIVEKADQLQYNDVKYAEISKKNLLLLIQVARTGDKNIFRDLSPYFKGGLLRRIHGNVSYALSFFGPNPPSFSYGAGKDVQVFQIPKNNTDQDPNLTMKDGKTSLAYLPYKKVGISGAISQFDNLLSTGKIRIPLGRQGKKEFTNLALADGQIHAKEFQEVYESLKAAVVDCAARDSATGKRKRADEVGEGSSKKRVLKKATEEKAQINAGNF